MAIVATPAAGDQVTVSATSLRDILNQLRRAQTYYAAGVHGPGGAAAQLRCATELLADVVYLACDAAPQCPTCGAEVFSAGECLDCSIASERRIFGDLEAAQR